jgi:hypothetical protein
MICSKGDQQSLQQLHKQNTRNLQMRNIGHPLARRAALFDARVAHWVLCPVAALCLAEKQHKFIPFPTISNHGGQKTA